jgi:hypothetical protein
MSEEESQTKETPGINVEITSNQEEKDQPPHRRHRSVSLEALKAERLFNQYCYPKTWYWDYPEWKQAALSILSSGIFEGNELKGHARRQNYPVVQGDSVVLGDLIIDLVQIHFDYDVNLPSGQVFHRLEGSLVEDIVGKFDDHFRFVAAIALLGGIRSDLVQNTWDDWRKKVSTRAVEGKISPRWRQIIMNEIFPGYDVPKKIAYAFADIFLRYVPKVPKEVPPARIAEWVNVTLESLGRPKVDDSVLRQYISNERQRISQLPTQITE